MPVDEMMDVIEADESDENQIDGNDVVNNRGMIKMSMPAMMATSGVICVAVITMGFPRVGERAMEQKGEPSEAGWARQQKNARRRAWF